MGDRHAVRARKTEISWVLCTKMQTILIYISSEGNHLINLSLIELLDQALHDIPLSWKTELPHCGTIHPGRVK